MSVIDDKINSLSLSKFRSSFHLRKYMIEYIKEKGLEKIEEDAYYFIKNRLSDISKVRDGHLLVSPVRHQIDCVDILIFT